MCSDVVAAKLRGRQQADLPPKPAPQRDRGVTMSNGEAACARLGAHAVFPRQVSEAAPPGTEAGALPARRDDLFLDLARVDSAGGSTVAVSRSDPSKVPRPVFGARSLTLSCVAGEPAWPLITNVMLPLILLPPCSSEKKRLAVVFSL